MKLFLCLAIQAFYTFCSGSLQFVRKQVTVTKTFQCYSCMSTSYLTHWRSLMTNFYPPHNFSDQCNAPDHHPEFGPKIGTVPCDEACVTVIERYRLKGYHGQRYMRSCSDRLLLFGLDTPLRNEIAPNGPEEFCRVSKKDTMPLPGNENPAERSKRPFDEYLDLIVLCSCVSDRCNKMEMFDNRAHDAQISVMAVILPALSLVVTDLMFW